MKIALFGGTFDPPHVGHQIVAEEARDTCGLHCVWWIPAGRSPHKLHSTSSAAEDRLVMTRLATERHKEFSVSNVELRRSLPSRTVDTVRELVGRYPDCEFSLLVGMDNLSVFDEWFEPAEIVKMVPIIAYPRSGMTCKHLPAYLEVRVSFLDSPEISISATEIRRRVSEGRSIRYLVCDEVREYIERKGLYQPRSSMCRQGFL